MSRSSVLCEDHGSDEDYFLNFILSTESQNQIPSEDTMTELAFGNQDNLNPLSASMDFSNNLAE